MNKGTNGVARLHFRRLCGALNRITAHGWVAFNHFQNHVVRQVDVDEACFGKKASKL